VIEAAAQEDAGLKADAGSKEKIAAWMVVVASASARAEETPWCVEE